ncbi:MAG: hypothetical protein Q8O42_18770 [Acidobacteriota bacterium]|nr:hypothetical protein [Acidobacteriota bacterium]
MAKDEDAIDFEKQAVEFIRTELAKASPTGRKRLVEKFILAALGSIPWVGGFISAAASYKAEEGTVRTDNLQTQWLEEHARKIAKLMAALAEVVERLETLGPEIEIRIQSEEYLSLVRRSFRTWDRADSEEKRRYVQNLVSNAAGTKLTSDDVIRLFIDWLDLYHEAHFAVIREIYANPGSSRFLIWDAIHGELPREDSAEADLFKLLIRDLSTGGVVRQDRDTNQYGQFLRRKQPRRKGSVSATMESAFEEAKPYVLTALGQQFVHYTMNEIVPRIGSAPK